MLTPFVRNQGSPPSTDGSAGPTARRPRSPGDAADNVLMGSAAELPLPDLRDKKQTLNPKPYKV